MNRTVLFAALLVAASPAWAAPAAITPDEAAFRTTYRTLVETDTTLTHGDCTLAAARMADTLRAAGFSDDRLIAYAAPDHPREGGLVAILPGHSSALKPLLLVAHLDVVEARREDWPRDPFVLTETGGYFHARGAFDDKAQAAIFVDALANLSRAHAKPKRTIKLALTCGEETNGAFNGAQWLAENRRELIDAAFALNEGGGGRTDGRAGGAKVIAQTIQIGEKTFANFVLETRNRGGHSSAPRPENAIYQLAHALDRIEAYTFPVEFTPITTVYFHDVGTARGGAVGAAMVALAADPADGPGYRAALWQVDTDAFLHANIRTTCVATMLDAGHAPNALAQRARATVNCRIFPGHNVDAIGHELERVIGDPEVGVTALAPLRPAPPPPALDPAVLDPARKLVAKYWPGVALVPAMANGYTDATFLTAAGIPTYGAPGLWGDPDGNGVHGLDERISVQSLMTGRLFLDDLIRAYAF
ncbi:M20/M25/M40 family metallo-hydrolase [Novosphingobium sp.]|uniref:M20/M25/M40 family metallo-hydrolase n=1 Tax=Novosphingobium sp. TaxID=1874826 RepID=UPI003D0EB4D4